MLAEIAFLLHFFTKVPKMCNSNKNISDIMVNFCVQGHIHTCIYMYKVCGPRAEDMFVPTTYCPAVLRCMYIL